jgi:hypothetical protein
MDRTECTQLIAPGHKLALPALGGGVTDESHGTSFSSPHAAAVAALLGGRCLSPDQIVDLMKRTGTVVSDGCASGAHDVVAINAFAAVAAAEAEFPLCTDCNHNLKPDGDELAAGRSQDCNANGVPDECEGADCNRNGVPDDCDLAQRASFDCNANSIPDECDVLGGAVALAPPASYPMADSPAALALVGTDLDQDGHLDLATSSSSANSVSVLWNVGNGAFSGPDRYADAGGNPLGIAAGDLTGDGRVDLATANSSSSRILVLENRGGRSFAPGESIALEYSPSSLIIADLDGSGSADVAASSRTRDKVAVLLAGTGAVLGAPTYHDVANAPGKINPVDWEGDGDLDLVVSNTTINPSILLNRGDGSFELKQDLDVGVRISILTAADLDLDGRPDLALSTSANVTDRLRVLRAREDGSFASASYSPWEGPLPLNANDLLAADLNGDLYPDLVAGFQTANAFSVLLNRGDGTFSEGVLLDAGGSPRGLVARDFDRDGRLDLAATLLARAFAFAIYRNQTALPASADCNQNRIPDDCELRGGTSADVDADGIPDDCEPDCNANALPDDFEIASGASADCNQNRVPDACDPDCDQSGQPDACEIASGAAADCNGNRQPDACDLAGGVSRDTNQNTVPDECEPAQFRRGDCNGDRDLDISDPISNLGYLFSGKGVLDCIEACNVNSDEANDLSDAVYMLAHLFTGGPPPGAPYPDCGLDPEPGTSLGCERLGCE